METPSANSPTYSLGLDYGTSSVRALITSNHSANALSSAVCGYAHGEDGILLDSNKPDLARQAPSDYLTGAKQAIRESIVMQNRCVGRQRLVHFSDSREHVVHHLHRLRGLGGELG